MHRFLSYFRYWLYCVNEHSLHSPLIYDLYRKVIRPSKKWPADLDIEALRFELLKSEVSINVNDLGTGKDKSPDRLISDIMKKAGSSPQKSLLLRGLAEYFECKKILELGTSFGINSLYLSRVKEAELVTFEGCENTATIAKKQFETLNVENVKLIEGDIDATLPYFLDRSGKIDFVFFDANHAYKPTIDYYEWCYHRAHDDTVFVFDDIHANPEMEKAWSEINSKVEVMLTADLYHMGIVIFDPNLSRQRYVLDY